ncbi:hypothetical protein [Pedobacter sp.]
MNEFKDFFKELKERATSPFFGSFIISWCLINWPILLAIFFTNDENVKDRFTFIYELIIKHQNFFSFFMFPFLCAVGYTFGYPFIRRLIKWHIATQTAKSDSAILKSTGIASVSLENYITMKEAQEASQKKLSGLINDQQKVLSDQEKLRKQLNDEKVNSLNLKQSTIDLHEKIDSKVRFGQMIYYLGSWGVIDKTSKKISEFWLIEEREIIFDQKDPGSILSFLADPEQRLIAFQLRIKTLVEKSIDSTGALITSQLQAGDANKLYQTVEIEELYIFKVSDDMNSLTSVTSDENKAVSLKRL